MEILRYKKTQSSQKRIPFLPSWFYMLQAYQKKNKSFADKPFLFSFPSPFSFICPSLSFFIPFLFLSTFQILLFSSSFLSFVFSYNFSHSSSASSYSLFYSFPPTLLLHFLFPSNSQIEKRKFNQNSNSTYCIFMVNKPYAITCSVVAFYIPFLLMVLAYYRIYVTAKEHAHQIQMLQRAGAPTEGRLQPTDQHSTHRMRTETKAAKTLCIIMGCFCLCWAPFFVTNIVDPFVDYTVPGQVWTAFLWLGYINSGLNPFLYAFLNKSFRRAFLIILCCDDERYRRPSILGQTVPCSTTTINGSTHVLR